MNLQRTAAPRSCRTLWFTPPMLDTLTAWKDTRVTAWITAGVILAEIQEVSSLYVVLSPPLLMWAYARVRSCLVSKIWAAQLYAPTIHTLGCNCYDSSREQRTWIGER